LRPRFCSTPGGEAGGHPRSGRRCRAVWRISLVGGLAAGGRMLAPGGCQQVPNALCKAFRQVLQHGRGDLAFGTLSKAHRRAGHFACPVVPGRLTRAARGVSTRPGVHRLPTARLLKDPLDRQNGGSFRPEAVPFRQDRRGGAVFHKLPTGYAEVFGMELSGAGVSSACGHCRTETCREVRALPCRQACGSRPRLSGGAAAEPLFTGCPQVFGTRLAELAFRHLRALRTETFPEARVTTCRRACGSWPCLARQGCRHVQSSEFRCPTGRSGSGRRRPVCPGPRVGPHCRSAERPRRRAAEAMRRAPTRIARPPDADRLKADPPLNSPAQACRQARATVAAPPFGNLLSRRRHRSVRTGRPKQSTG